MEYTLRMVKILRTAEFDSWLDSLKDRLAQSSVQARIDRMGTTIVLLLCGGAKSSQNRDIERALEMARILKE